MNRRTAFNWNINLVKLYKLFVKGSQTFDQFNTSFLNKIINILIFFYLKHLNATVIQIP